MDALTFEIIAFALAALAGAGVFAGFYFKGKKDAVLPPSPEQQSFPEVETESITGDLEQLEIPEKVKPIMEPVEEPKAKEPPVKATKDLRSALENTRSSFFGRIKAVLSNDTKMTDDDMENLEEVLYTSDLGPATVQRLVEAISAKLEGQDKGNLDRVQTALRDEMRGIFLEMEEKSEFLNNIETYFKETALNSNGPRVMMVVGVNGVGKTTTIGKLAFKSAASGLKTMVIAGDTFRAAAEDQLKVWGERASVEVFSPEGVKDPSAVIFDGLQSAKAKDMNMVIVDTAGRLHTQDNLMEELKKMRRVMGKVLPEAPHEIMLVLDANSGQNALVQARTFHDALDIDGVVLTKLDGSAKGGVAVGIACELQLPIKLIGVGEGIDDLRAFESGEFVESII